jgi:2-keto-3-deoxy-L-rhamnonate aldolase RhmA
LPNTAKIFFSDGENMMKHRFRRRLLEGELLVGTMLSLTSPDVAEIMAEAGFDWLFVDGEHAAFDVRDTQNVMQGAGKETPCIVRLPAGDEVAVKRALDTGAAGIIAPQVNTAEQAARIVGFAKYPPRGIRGVGLARAQGYGLRFAEYMQSANEDIAVIIQAEHRDAVENIEKIVRVEGIDGVFVGPYDLSASLGQTGRVDHPVVVSAIDRVREACLEAGIRLGIFGMSAGELKPFIENGFTFILAGADILFLGQAAKSILTELKA